MIGAATAGVLFAVLGFLVVPSLSGTDSIRFRLFGHLPWSRSDISAHSALPPRRGDDRPYSRLTVYQHLADSD